MRKSDYLVALHVLLDQETSAKHFTALTALEGFNLIVHHRHVHLQILELKFLITDFTLHYLLE